MPRAVVLVGGGSQTAGLKEHISRHLGLPTQRIGSRLPKQVEHFSDTTGKVNGAEMITPLGIARTGIQKEGIDFVDVTVNGSEMHLMDVNGLSIMDALVAAKVKRLYPRPGMALSLKVNSEFITIEGGMGEHAKITLNGKKAHLGEPIEKGSVIDFVPPVDGNNAHVKVKELVEKEGLALSFKVCVNGKEKEYPLFVEIDGKEATFEQDVPDRAHVIIRELTLKDIVEKECDSSKNEKISVIVNNNVQYLDSTRYTLRLNDNNVDFSDISGIPVRDGDKINVLKEDFEYKLQDILSKPEEGRKVSILLNGEEVIFDGSIPQITLNGKKVDLSVPITDGDVIAYKRGKKQNPFFLIFLNLWILKRKNLLARA
ncbi:MAG: hypothetical protein R2741_11990 [Methanolobus sp.]